MPLPKPSRMVSKRFKKPKTINPCIHPPPAQQPLHPDKLWPDLPHRTWCVRVVCTDPDATDDSSADESESSISPNTARKRLIRKICLPAPPPSSPKPQRRRREGSPMARSRKFTKVILQDVDALLDGAAEVCARPAPPLMLPSAEFGDMEEEFACFLSEFLPDEHLCDKIDELGSPPTDHEVSEMLNLELDSEALTWINSLQRLP